VIAISNHVAMPKFELRTLPVARSDDLHGSLWKRFVDDLIQPTKEGISECFGRPIAKHERMRPIQLVRPSISSHRP